MPITQHNLKFKEIQDSQSDIAKEVDELEKEVNLLRKDVKDLLEVAKEILAKMNQKQEVKKPIEKKGK